MNPSKRPAIYVLFAVAVAVLVMGFAAMFVRQATLTAQIRDTQVTNTRARESSDKVLTTIEDCTQPAGKCYQRGQKQTAAAVGDINRVVILASACSVGLDSRLSVAERQTAIQSCVIERLARGDSARP